MSVSFRPYFKRIVKTLVLVFFCLLSKGTSGQSASYSGDTRNGPVFARPLAGNPSLERASGSLGGNVRSHTQNFIPDRSGRYQVVSAVTSRWNNFLAVYRGAFQPASPLTNLIAARDSVGNPAQVTIDGLPLEAGVRYVLVTAGRSNSDAGAFVNTMTLQSPDILTTTLDPTLTLSEASGGIFYRPIANDEQAPRNLVTSTLVPFRRIPFRIVNPEPGNGESLTGWYRLVSTPQTPGFSPFTVLYRGDMTPSQPLKNALIANHRFQNSDRSGFDVHLTEEVDYTLVVTGFGNNDFGLFSLPEPLLERIDKQETSRDTLAASAPRYGRVEEDGTLSAFADNVPYHPIRFQVGAEGSYDLTVSTSDSDFDLFTTLYRESFVPANAVSNVVRANDDKYGLLSLSGFDNVPLQANQVYTMVVSGYSNADRGHFQLKITGPGKIDFLPDLGASDATDLSGTLVFADAALFSPEEYLCHTRRIPLLCAFQPTDGSLPFTRTVRTEPSQSQPGRAHFVIPQVPHGSYLLRIKPERFLRAEAAVTVSSVTSFFEVTVTGGDSNDDNFVDALDLADLITAFNTATGDPDFNPAADFNCDGFADALDLAILINNFNLEGAPGD